MNRRRVPIDCGAQASGRSALSRLTQGPIPSLLRRSPDRCTVPRRSGHFRVLGCKRRAFDDGRTAGSFALAFYCLEMAEPWDVKLNRAREHLVELRRSIDELRASGDFTVTIDETGRERVVRLVVKSEPPVRLSAIVGDFIHNLRSSLDCVMLAACETSSGPLTEDEERDVQFPITSTPTKFAGQLYRIKRASSDVIDTVRQMQPWVWLVDPSMPALSDEALIAEVQHHQLLTLAELSNVDKHRRIHLTAWYPKDIFVGTPEGVDVQWRHASASERERGEIGRWIVSGDGAESVKLEGNGEAGLTLQRYVDMGWPDIELTDLLQGQLQHVASIVARILVMSERREPT
jgi:hypothetical protein